MKKIETHQDFATASNIVLAIVLLTILAIVRHTPFQTTSRVSWIDTDCQQTAYSTKDCSESDDFTVEVVL